jgi:hypothetical protein
MKGTGTYEGTAKDALVWQIPHMQGHPWWCKCGQRFAGENSLENHVRKRTYSKCAPDDEHNPEGLRFQLCESEKDAPGWYCACGDLHPTYQRMVEHVRFPPAGSSRQHYWDTSRGQQAPRPCGGLCSNQGCIADLGGAHVMGVVEECVYFDPLFDEMVPSMTITPSMTIASGDRPGEGVTLIEETSTITTIAVINTEGDPVQVSIGDSVHYVRDRGGACIPAHVNGFHMTYIDPTKPDEGTEFDSVLGTLNLTGLGGGSMTADFSPDRLLKESWHTADTCPNAEKMTQEVTEPATKGAKKSSR